MGLRPADTPPHVVDAADDRSAADGQGRCGSAARSSGAVRLYAEIALTEPADADAPVEKKRTAEKLRTGVEHLVELARRSKTSGAIDLGLGMYLIRDGVLHIGPGRLVVSGTARDLTPANGLIEIRRNGTVLTDPTFDASTAGAGEKAPSRDLVEMTMKGRPDLKPGDFVNVALPPEEVPDDSPNPDGWMGGVRRHRARGPRIGRRRT